MKIKPFWVTAWRAEGIPEDVIDRFYKRYGAPSPELTEAILNDDNLMGVGKLSIPYTNDEVKRHDIEMLLAKLGYPITTNLETQGEFVEETLERTGKAVVYAVLGVPIAVVGGTVGYFLGVARGWW